MNKVLLAGATGYLGSHIAEELIKQGFYTRLLIRDIKRLKKKVYRCEIRQAQVTQQDTLSGSMNGIDVVISTVGITRQKDGLTYMDVDYQANMNLLKEAKKAGVKKFIYVSALNADKLTHIKMCYAKERFVLELMNSGLDFCVIRPNGFFTDMAEFLKMAKKGKAQLFGDGNYSMNPIHGKDLAEVCVNAITLNEKTIEVGGPELYTHNEIIELAFKTLGKKSKINYMPDGLRKMVLWLARTFTSSRTHGPMEFFFTVLAMDMVAPRYGSYVLDEYFEKVKSEYS